MRMVGFRWKIYKNYSQNLSKQIVKKKATFPREKNGDKDRGK